MKRIAVCGGFGTTGMQACRALKALGHYVVVFDRVLPSAEAVFDEYFLFDLENPPEYYSAFRWQDFGEVHLCAPGETIAAHVAAACENAEVKLLTPATLLNSV